MDGFNPIGLDILTLESRVRLTRIFFICLVASLITINRLVCCRIFEL